MTIIQSLAVKKGKSPLETYEFEVESPQNFDSDLIPLIMKQRQILYYNIRGRAMMMEMLSVAERYGVKPIVEVFLMEKVNEAL